MTWGDFRTAAGRVLATLLLVAGWLCVLYLGCTTVVR